MKPEIFPFDNNPVSREEFVNSVKDVVEKYIDNFYDYDKNPILRVNPLLKLVEVQNGYGFQEDIGYNDEVVEEGAAAEGDASESSTDYQAKQDYDFYPVREFFKVDANGQGSPDEVAINKLADKYYPA